MLCYQIKYKIYNYRTNIVLLILNVNCISFNFIKTNIIISNNSALFRNLDEILLIPLNI